MRRHRHRTQQGHLLSVRLTAAGRLAHLAMSRWPHCLSATGGSPHPFPECLPGKEVTEYGPCLEWGHAPLLERGVRLRMRGFLAWELCRLIPISLFTV